MTIKEATPGNKRRIKELAELYKRHPEARDVFVEGSRDKCFFTWFFQKANLHNPIIYEISTVEIPSQFIDKYTLLHKNNKHKLMAFSFEIEPKLTGNRLQVTCIVDRDFDSFIKRHSSCSLLLFTDYSCLEMYSFNEICINKFLNVFIGRIFQSAQQLLMHLINPLQQLFIIKLANESMSLGLAWIDFKRYCSLNGQQIVFDELSFIRNYLNSNSMSHKKDDFLKQLLKLKPLMFKDPRLQIHGHDYIKLLVFYLRKLGADKVLCNAVVVQRGLFTSIEYQDLILEPLFKNLLSRLIS